MSQTNNFKELIKNEHPKPELDLNPQIVLDNEKTDDDIRIEFKINIKIP